MFATWSAKDGGGGGGFFHWMGYFDATNIDACYLQSLAVSKKIPGILYS